jgi:metal-sulfur cluster biosynthetic enzyme
VIAAREQSARIAQGENEQMNGLRLLADPHAQLPIVDLGLLARLLVRRRLS